MTAVDATALETRLGTAKRSVAVLTVAQAILGSAAPLSISIGGLAGFSLLGDDKSLATVPVTGNAAGAVSGAVSVSASMGSAAAISGASNGIFK